MKLASISIQNFRGIRQGLFYFPLNQRLICIIGPGDSCKSTLLKAIEWSLWPTWSLTATDLDFYNGNTETPIVIDTTVAEVPDELLSEDKYGLYLRDLEAILLGTENDEPVDGGTSVITIRLTIDSSLEPTWAVITNRTDPRPIAQKDRRLLSFGVVGFDYEKDFLWGRGSILQKYSDTSKGALHSAYTQAMRSAVENTNLTELDHVTTDILSVGAQYGVSFSGELHNKLMMQNGSYSTAVGVFDKSVPFSQRGLGSKRLLSMGLNIHASSDGSLILVDEIETGLEPYRICTLINQLRAEFSAKGQIIFTTHSRSVVCECTTVELFVISDHDGTVSLSSLSKEDINEDVQAIIRTEPDSFLCKRLIVCEGKTEIGLLRSLDNTIYEKKGIRFAHYGVGTALGGGGEKTFKLAELLKKCGYNVAILMDADIEAETAEKKHMESLGIAVFSWENGNAIEEQLFKDVDLDTAEALLSLACESKTFDHVISKLNAGFTHENRPFYLEEGTIRLYEDSSFEERKKIGTIAKHKKSEWYKRIDLGEQVGNIVFCKYDGMADTAGFKVTIEQLKKWVKDDETRGNSINPDEA